MSRVVDLDGDGGGDGDCWGDRSGGRGSNLGRGGGGWGEEEEIEVLGDALLAWGNAELSGPSSGEGEGGINSLGLNLLGGVGFGGEGNGQNEDNKETEAQSVVLSESSAKTSGSQGDESHDGGESRSVRDGGLGGRVGLGGASLWWLWGGGLRLEWDNIEGNFDFSTAVTDIDDTVVGLTIDVNGEVWVGDGSSLDEESEVDLLVNGVESDGSDGGSQIDGRGQGGEEEESAED